MQEEAYISLFQKKLSGPLSPTEQSDLDGWLAQSPDNQLIANQIERVWQASGQFNQPVEVDEDADFAKLERRIAAAAMASPSPKVVAMRPRRNWLAIAAAVLLLATAPLVMRKFMAGETAQAEFASGNAAATTPVELADGSKVWVNKASTLRYFTSNEGKERRVELSGEAFFEVAKDAERPFVVQTTLGKVTVLGTSFNVKDDPRAQTLEVNVSTGKVRLQPTGAQQQLLLVANETGIFDQTKNSLVKSGGAANNTAAWHTQRLVFENASFEEALQQLSALHGITLSVDNEQVKRCTLTVTFDRKPLAEALETLSTMFGAKLEKLSENEYRFKGGRCG
jgi:ferric-dicitrate binding protein FerR (iron transport regulator)